MKFDEYIQIQSKKAGRKLCALGRVCKFLNLERRRKVFIESQFAYTAILYGCPVAEVEIIVLICMNEH